MRIILFKLQNELMYAKSHFGVWYKVITIDNVFFITTVLLRCWMIFFKICMLKNTGMEYEIQVIASFPGQFLKLIFVTVCRNDHKYLGVNTITR